MGAASIANIGPADCIPNFEVVQGHYCAAAPPADAAIDAEVDLGKTGDAYLLQARLKVSLPGLERNAAQAIVDRTHQTYPYSKAGRGNIDATDNSS